MTSFFLSEPHPIKAAPVTQNLYPPDQPRPLIPSLIAQRLAGARERTLLNHLRSLSSANPEEAPTSTASGVQNSLQTDEVTLLDRM
jgi:hypothetical protein